MLSGAIAAAVTPLRNGGRSPDLDAVGSLVEFLVGGGMDGLLALGTTGEGMLLSPAERMRTAEAFVAARPGRFDIAVHAGAQTTADTVALARHARSIGADAVAAIAPPYFPLDEHELLAHLLAAARACDPVPFYVYEFEARSGYAIPVSVIERLAGAADNLRGLKVSDTPWERIEPYLIEGLDLFIGLEPQVERGLARGARGAVSGLATAFPEIVDELVHQRTSPGDGAVRELRVALDGIPFQGAMKAALAWRGLSISEDVRGPLRGLAPDERARWFEVVRELVLT